MSDEPIITLWMFIPPRQTFELEGQTIAPIITPIRYTAQHIAQRLNFPQEVNALYFETEEQAKEHLANYLAAQGPRFTIDDYDKVVNSEHKGYYVTMHIEGREYIGALRLYKDEDGTVME